RSASRAIYRRRMPDWGEIFSPTTPILEILIRGTVMFLAIHALMRVTGQRESGVHFLSDLLVVVLVAQAAAYGLTGGDGSVIDSVLLVATILGWRVAVDAMAYRLQAVRWILKA